MKIVPNDTRRVKYSPTRSSSRHFFVTLLDLFPGLKKYSNRKGGEYRGACPKCGGGEDSDRLIVWPRDGKGFFWCRQCHFGGDAITFLMEARGLSYREAAERVGKELEPAEKRLQGLKLQAREKQRERYYGWWHEKLDAWNELLDELFYAEVAYRALTRVPDLYSEHEHHFWTKRLGDLYFQHTVMQQLLDLTDAERFVAWRQEAGKR